MLPIHLYAMLTIRKNKHLDEHLMGKTLYTNWHKKQQAALTGENGHRIADQIKTGKNTARERIAMLLDAASFQEIDQLAQSHFLADAPLTDGVITGFGTINGARVAIYAQDFTIKGGSLGKRHAEKICKVMDMAAKTGCPIIGIIDSGGARIDEGIHALAGYGTIFKRNVLYSGVIPQISLVLGPCAGGASYSPALTDIIFMTKENSHLFITGPQVIGQALHQTITKDELGGSDIHGRQSGVAHVVCNDETEVFTKVKELLSLLPHNYLENNALEISAFQKTDLNTPLQDLVPPTHNQAYDIKKVILALTDNNKFFELQELFAPNIVTGFCTIGGITVGIVANQPNHKAGTIDIDASVKAARFINFCDSFEIPLVSLVDVPGFLPGIEQEHQGIIRHGAKLLFAYAQSTIPKITVILRKAFGGAYIVMGSKELGADFNFAWPNTQIAVVGATSAVSVLHRKTLAALPIEEQAAVKKDLENKYTEEFLNPFVAAQYGYIDAIIEPNDTRKHIIAALQITVSKTETQPKKKHGNTPL